jgi:hypothetical protein
MLLFCIKKFGILTNIFIFLIDHMEKVPFDMVLDKKV